MKNNRLQFWPLFRAARENLGLTQVEFARRLRCSQGAVSKIESGVMEPSASTLAYLYCIHIDPGADHQWESDQHCDLMNGFFNEVPARK